MTTTSPFSFRLCAHRSQAARLLGPDHSWFPSFLGIPVQLYQMNSKKSRRALLTRKLRNSVAPERRLKATNSVTGFASVFWPFAGNDQASSQVAGLRWLCAFGVIRRSPSVDFSASLEN